ncbi:MAG: glycosyltransferase, partial [Anaerolineae bacterium]
MKVAIDARVVQDRFPGIGRYVFRLAEALPAAVPDITVVVLHNRNQSDTRFDLTGLGRSQAVRLRTVTGDLRSLQGQWSVRRALSQEEVDVYHATYWIGAYLPGVPTLLTLYDVIGLDPSGGLPTAKRLLLKALVRLALARADHVATLSSDSRRGLIAAGVSPTRITITPLAADPDLRPASKAAVAALRERFALPRHYVLYVGTTKPHK